MHHQWPQDTPFKRITLVPEDRTCGVCRRHLQICDHRYHRIFRLGGPVEIISKLCHCPDTQCAAHPVTISPAAELALTMPWWLIGWDVFAWMGYRRFARHWSLPQIRKELADSQQVFLSADSVEHYVGLYQNMVAARQQEPTVLAAEYNGVQDLILTIDGLQPEKGHETLYVVRELRRRRVWFAEPLLSSAAGEVRRLFEQARTWAQRLGLPVKLWMSDKQDAFVSGVASVFPGVPHRYCQNHFLRDLAKPMLEADSAAKVQMRRKVRGLREIEREVLDQRQPTEPKEQGLVVLDYCAAVRGVLNDDQGGPLHPPGLRMAGALREIQASLQRNLDAKKGAQEKSSCAALTPPCSGVSTRLQRRKRNCSHTSRRCVR